jgi:hypothetical protein
MNNTPETEHFACALQMQSMQNQIEELTNMLRNTERGLAEAQEQRDMLADALREIAEGSPWGRRNAIWLAEQALAAVEGGSDE